jgi:hypothetical protein
MAERKCRKLLHGCPSRVAGECRVLADGCLSTTPHQRGFPNLDMTEIAPILAVKAYFRVRVIHYHTVDLPTDGSISFL